MWDRGEGGGDWGSQVCVGVLMPGCYFPQVFDLHYADGSHLKGFNGVDQVWVSGPNPRINVVVPTDTGWGWDSIVWALMVR